MYRTPFLLVIVLVILLAFIPGLLSAETITLTVDDAVERAVERDPELRQLELSVDEARRSYEQRWNIYQPSVSASTSLSRSLFPDENVDPWSAGVGASASVSWPQAAGSRAAQRNISLEKARLDLEEARANLEQSVREQFFAALLAGEQLAISERNEELSEARREQAEELFEDGRISRLELIEARSAAVGRQPELVGQQRDVASALYELKGLTGIEPGTEVELSGSLEVDVPSLARDEVIAAVREGSFTLRGEELARRERQADLETTTASGFAPSFSTSVNWQPSISPAFEGEAWSDRDTWRTGSVSFNVSIPLDPWLPGSDERLDRESAERSIRRQEIDRSSAEEDIVSRANELLDELDFSRETLAALEEAIEVERERFELTETAFDDGAVELLDVEDARLDLENRELDLLQARASLLSTLFELDILAGGTITEELIHVDTFE